MTDQISAGQRFGLLIVLSRDTSALGKPRWHCQCDCGNARTFGEKALLSGAGRSCGCQTARARARHSRDQQRFDLAAARKQLAAAQLALTEAIHSLDAEAITSARHVQDEAMNRVRHLLSWRTNAALGKGRPQ